MFEILFRFWDFYSDLNLSIEIMTREDLFEDVLILVSGFGSCSG